MNKLLGILAAITLVVPIAAFATTDTFTSSGFWTAPAGVTSVTADVWGGGGGSAGGGFSSDGAGGGGGAYSQKVNITVVPGNSYPLTVGLGGIAFIFTGGASTAGGDSMFLASSTVLAKGGGAAADNATPGTGGAAGSGVGDTKFSGGNGIDDGGGGGGAGTTANGGNASVPTGGTGGSVGGGAGGNDPGGNGSVKGGAGGAGAASLGAGGTSARGEVQLTYTVDPIVNSSNAASTTNSFAASPTLTFSATPISGDTLGVLSCMVWQDVAGTGTVGAATFNGSAITLATSTRTAAMYSYIGYIISPASGAHTVSVPISGNIDAVKCGFSTYTGTDTTAPLDVVKATSGVSGSPITATMTTTRANDLVVDAVSRFGTIALTRDATQIPLTNDITGSTGFGSSYKIAGAAGSVTMQWTTTGSNDISIAAASFKTASAVTTKSPPKLIVFGDW